jgi:hypothetical protein
MQIQTRVHGRIKHTIMNILITNICFKNIPRLYIVYYNEKLHAYVFVLSCTRLVALLTPALARVCVQYSYYVDVHATYLHNINSLMTFSHIINIQSKYRLSSHSMLIETGHRNCIRNTERIC